MFKVTFTYERYSDKDPFYWETEEGAYYKKKIALLGQSTGLVKNYDNIVTEDNLTSITTYEFDSKDDWLEFFKQVHELFPEFKLKRLEYLLNNSHFFSGSASEPVFLNSQEPGVFSTTFITPN